ncbi:hypothetical protein AaE_014098 [Aphanomyces astaci]|uniref:Uncharacterized protein n=1 Tax=Aphanomyces astaci TaxID=112090 RepID=A0A6A4Z7G3_APHAT|nr:hypothetical protein AaE_014098 [Aphanomyces astaci]
MWSDYSPPKVNMWSTQRWIPHAGNGSIRNLEARAEIADRNNDEPPRGIRGRFISVRDWILPFFGSATPPIVPLVHDPIPPIDAFMSVDVPDANHIHVLVVFPSSLDVVFRYVRECNSHCFG